MTHMQSDTRHQLAELGLTPGEVQVYLALIAHSPLTKSGLSVHAKVSSSKVYEIAERLVRKGLIGTMVKQGKKQYHAHDPDRLMRFIEEREKRIREEKLLVQKIIPLMRNLKTLQETPRFEMFEGNDGLEQCIAELFEDLNQHREIRGFGIELRNEGLLHKYHRMRTRKKIAQRLIFSDRDLAWTSYPGKEMRFIPKITDIGIGISDHKVLLVSYGEQTVTLLIEHPAFNRSFLRIFDKLWSIAEE